MNSFSKLKRNTTQWARSPSNVVLLGGIVIYWIIFVFFYPNFYSVSDERQYLGKAFQLAQGDLFPVIETVQDSWWEKYPTGVPMILAALFRIDANLIYCMNAVFLTCVTLLASVFFSDRKLPSYYALLVMFHPVFFIFSRTIMSDLPATFCLLLAFRLIEKEKHWLVAGLLLGFSISIRIASGPLVLLLALFALPRIWRGKWRLVKVTAGGAIGLLPFVYYMIRSASVPYFIYKMDFLDPSHTIKMFLPHVAYYAMTLNLIYPLQMIIGVYERYKGDVWHKLLIVLPFLYMPLLPIHPSHFENDGLTLLVLRQRYFLLPSVFMLLGYCAFLHRHVLNAKWRLFCFLAALGVFGVVASKFHSEFLDARVELRNLIYSVTPENATIVGDDRPEEVILDMYGIRKTFNVEIYRNTEDLLQDLSRHVESEFFLVRNDVSDTEMSDLDRNITDGVDQMLKTILEKYPSELVAEHDDYLIYKVDQSSTLDLKPLSNP